jgi:DNA (cytosine-5)-methyltransferase 1
MKKLLDLFCGAGGAAKGYQRAGFHVTGVDLNPQPRYCGDVFHQGDALAFVREHGHEFDAIHASPPCQAHTALKTMYNARVHSDLIPATRRALKRLGLPWVIENVPGAPLIDALVLCGSMFHLRTADERAELRRHRLFESSFPVASSMQCQHSRITVGVYGDGNGRDYRRFPAVIGVYGDGRWKDKRRIGTRCEGAQQFSTRERGEAMGIDWMTGNQLSQAIPPAYTEYIGRALALALSSPRLAAAA